MILRFPSGLYRTQIPLTLEDSGSITWTISTDDPEKTPGPLFLQLPIAEQITARLDKVFSDEIRRLSIGELISTITNSGPSGVNAGKKKFEVGDVLEFTIEEEFQLALSLTPNSVDIIHNNNILDLSEFGLTQNEIDNFQDSSSKKFDELRINYNITKEKLENIKIDIDNNQKLINEINKSISAAQLVFTSTDDASIIDKLDSKRNELISERDVLIDENNVLAAELSEIYNNILAVSRLVK